VDLLFQRLGRLHRHARRDRPEGFELPRATVILPAEEGYGVHGKIYANSLVMWRTQQALELLANAPLVFPDAYRQWIVPIYGPELTGAEPQWVLEGLRLFQDKEFESRINARQMLTWAEATPLSDDNEIVRAVTRDGEMSLPVVPYIDSPQGRRLLDGQVFEQLPEFEQKEALSLNRVNVPNSWKSSFAQAMDDDGLIWLPGTASSMDFTFAGKNAVVFLYDNEQGLERIK
jgi:CRISPR-associated endonuclease/helicase Cas3